MAYGVQQSSEYSFHHENVLGTSLQLIVCTSDPAGAERIERVVLTEIERLRRILSTHDAGSEISRLNATAAPFACSPELLEVLVAYDRWNSRSAGAYNGHLGNLIDVWRAAQRAGVLPDATSLAPVVRGLTRPGWNIDSATDTVTRRSDATGAGDWQAEVAAQTEKLSGT